MTVRDTARSFLLAAETAVPATLPVLRTDLFDLVPAVRHGITRRLPGFGRADGNLGYSGGRDRRDAWRMRQLWAAAVGVEADRLTVAGQVHGATTIRATAADAGRGARPRSTQIGIADALITDEPGVPLLSLHADCLPIFLLDPHRPAVGVVHAGWRGTVADVAGSAVREMATAFGSDPASTLAFLGPAIGPCCYEVGPEVADRWRHLVGDAADGALRPMRPRPYFDLRAANAHLLLRAGLRPDHLGRSTVCTRCSGDDWFSHRGQGPATGRFGAIIALAADPHSAPSPTDQEA